MLIVKKLNGKMIKVTDGNIYFTCKIWQFKDKVELAYILQRSNFQFSEEKSLEIVNELHEKYLNKISS